MKIFKVVPMAVKDLFIVAFQLISIILTGFISFAVFCVIGIMIWWYQFNNSIFYENKFDRGEWLADDGYSKCIRGRMYEDLASNYLKKGMSKEEVIGLIGEPRIGRIYSRFYGDKKCYEYEIGPCKWAPTGDMLLVCFNKDEKVIDVFRSDGGDAGKSMYLNELNLKE